MIEKYDNIEGYPDHLSATTILVRMLDGMIFRFRWSVEKLDKSFMDFRPSEGAFSGKELLEHIFDLSAWLYRSYVDKNFNFASYDEMDDLIEKILVTLAEIRTAMNKMTDDELSKVTVYHNWSEEVIPYWNLINGPMSDFLTHIGQINSLRRIMGNPTPKANVFRGTAPRS